MTNNFEHRSSLGHFWSRLRGHTPDPDAPVNDSAPIPETWLLNAHVSEAQGTRETMEDMHMIIPDFAGVDGQGFYAVYDGHGDDVVAKYVVEHLHEMLLHEMTKRPNKPMARHFRETFLEIDSKINRLGISERAAVNDWAGSGTTAAVAFVRLEAADGASAKEKKGDPTRAGGGQRQRVLHCANVGDSRVVLCHGGKAIRLTLDHKPDDPEEKKRILRRNGTVEYGRIDGGSLNMSRCLGDWPLKRPGWVIGVPSVAQRVLGDEDEFLIIACDGLFDFVNDQEAVDAVRSKADPRDASSKLIELAFERRTNDNVTVMVVRLGPVPDIS
ncbi:protein serine/threonine phosphatase 2C [Punctularia strigosozonata HHB-11173 SS5]|uniref:protein serine/threonine phosphatase 2C n=1 Tax=Punctularia strigosozonata (strain HHB-11173) TaxID=741275 RepID=UPI0004418520|nr:protein serine/threonine phosphatase 2C [Punctularia strigosozonata HHB-11173 SS5]EIN09483.1 protein serine/threonine phosphatase 2C [Punctularia strigosozonata HHB-11173 SS5]